MATKELKICDVFGTTYAVESYVISFDCIKGNEVESVCEWKIDMSPRAEERLAKLIERGVRPPRRRKKTEGEDG